MAGYPIEDKFPPPPGNVFQTLITIGSISGAVGVENKSGVGSLFVARKILFAISFTKACPLLPISFSFLPYIALKSLAFVPERSSSISLILIFGVTPFFQSSCLLVLTPKTSQAFLIFWICVRTICLATGSPSLADLRSSPASPVITFSSVPLFCFCA